MQISISISAPQGEIDEDVITIPVSHETTIADLKIVIESETRIPIELQTLFHNGRPLLNDTQNLTQCRISDDDLLMMLVGGGQSSSKGQRSGQDQRQPLSKTNQSQSTQRRHPVPDPEIIRLQALGEPRVLENIRSVNPELAAAVADSERFRAVYQEMQVQQNDAAAEREREISLLNRDPFDIEAQTRIAEIIRKERVTENVEHAMEYTPEAFGRVHMLYIPVSVNSHPVKAFVDSGAQATIMSPSCAESCGIMRLVDERFAGMARGVGTAKVLGRVHSAQIKIGGLFLPCSFTVMEGKDVDLLLGLDMLKRHQACIDLHKNALVIQSQQVPFLGEADIPKYDFEEPTVGGPGGMQTSAISGAVSKKENGLGERGSDDTESHSTKLSNGQQASGVYATKFPPEDIAKLMDMGFTRDQAMQRLEIGGGNVDLAAGMILE